MAQALESEEMRKAGPHHYLKRSCLVATWKLKMETPWLFMMPREAPAFTRVIHRLTFPFI